jgi:hypothetical protein
MQEMQHSKEKVLADLIAHFEGKLREKQAEIDNVRVGYR